MRSMTHVAHRLNLNNFEHDCIQLHEVEWDMWFLDHDIVTYRTDCLDGESYRYDFFSSHTEIIPVVIVTKHEVTDDLVQFGPINYWTAFCSRNSIKNKGLVGSIHEIYEKSVSEYSSNPNNETGKILRRTELLEYESLYATHYIIQRINARSKN